MKQSLLILATVLTSAAMATSIFLSNIENPTDIQKQLNTTTNTIAVAGTTAIFGLLDGDDLDDKNSGR